MSRDRYPARRTGRQAILTLPGRIEVSNAGRIREELLLVINRGAIAQQESADGAIAKGVRA
jgi:hypothetical protein